MNVSELTDTELNRAMIWFYGDLHPKIDLIGVEDLGHRLVMDMGEGYDYSPDYLEDWNLTMPLAVENNLNPLFSRNGVASVPYYHSELMTTGGSVKKYGEVYYNKNPLRAICEVLVMIAMESKK